MATLADVQADVTTLQGDVTALQTAFSQLQAQITAGAADQATIDAIDAGLKKVHEGLGAIASPAPSPAPAPATT